MRKLLAVYANNKGTDQPAHMCILISAFVVHCLDIIVHILPKSTISVAEQAENPEVRFSHNL